MADPEVTYSFTTGTVASPSEVNTNFNDLITWTTANAVRKDGSVAFTQPVTGVNATSSLQLATLGQVNDGPAALQIATVALTDTSPSTVPAWEDYNGGYASFADPGRQVTILAWLSTDVSTASDELWTARVRLSISTNGGTSYTAGTAGWLELTGTSATDVTTGHLTVMQMTADTTPTGQVRIKAQLRGEQGAAPASLDFTDAKIFALMIPS